MDPIDYTDLINKKIDESVISSYRKTAAYTTAFNNVLPSLGLTYANFNKYLNDAVAKGFAPETAMDCYLLTLSMKS